MIKRLEWNLSHESQKVSLFVPARLDRGQVIDKSLGRRLRAIGFLSFREISVEYIKFFLLLFSGQLYENSLELSINVHGQNSATTCRIYMNMGIMYEDNDDYQNALECFTKTRDISEEVSKYLQSNYSSTV